MSAYVPAPAREASASPRESLRRVAGEGDLLRHRIARRLQNDDLHVPVDVVDADDEPARLCAHCPVFLRRDLDHLDARDVVAFTRDRERSHSLRERGVPRSGRALPRTGNEPTGSAGNPVGDATLSVRLRPDIGALDRPTHAAVTTTDLRPGRRRGSPSTDAEASRRSLASPGPRAPLRSARPTLIRLRQAAAARAKARCRHGELDTASTART
jgi:hypothetical protein